MRKSKEKRCLFCGRRFVPYPPLSGIQKTCGSGDCRKARLRRNHKRWIKLHPAYEHSQGRRTKVRAWAKVYPDYWRHYRKTHPGYRASDNKRRARALRKTRRSAKQTECKHIALGKLATLASLGPTDCSAKQTAWDPRVEGILEFLIQRETDGLSAKQIEWPGGPRLAA